jgi:hypothetical protein
MVFWAVLFTFSGVLTGFSLEITRLVSANQPTGRLSSTESSPNQVPIVGVASAIGLGLGIVLAATAYWWGAWQFNASPFALALIIALGAIGCATYHATAGALAGLQDWDRYSTLIAADAAARLILVAVIAVITRSVVAAAAAAALTFFTWSLIALLSPQVRTALRTRANVSPQSVASKLVAAAIATGSAGILVNGVPALLSLTTSAQIMSTVSPPVLLAITLTRAPLMIPLAAFQGVAISHFTRNQSTNGLAAIWPVGRIVLLVGVLGAAAAGLLGPWLLRTIWDFELSGAALASLTLGALGLALLTLTGWICQSLSQHRPFVAGWVSAVAVATIVLVVTQELSLASRTALALGAGSLVGIIIQLIAISRTRVTPATSGDDLNNAPDHAELLPTGVVA